MKKLLISVWCILTYFYSTGFHIVGGEIEFITLEPGKYRINLIQYFDAAQDDNRFADRDVTVYIFSNKDDAQIEVFTLPFESSEWVYYTNPECSREDLQTAKIFYTKEVYLNPESFADEEGYYIAWERCCRNEAVDNLVDPRNTGMKYIVDIPPLWKDGQPFINSSPELLKPLSDYACINQLYYMNFTGIDRDGDSLVYRLAVPLNSSSTDPVPITQPKPNQPVEFAPGYSLNNMIPGNPPLQISSKGLLTVSPDSTGLYVFSVVVEEWRSGEKIGEVQRDFQMLAIDGCEPPVPPEVGIRIPGNDDFDNEVDVLRYELEEDKCFDFVITNISAGENISLRAEPVNFDEDVEGLFSITDTLVGSETDTLLVKVCAPGCPLVRDGPFIIDLIASDDACPLPQMDTIRLMIEVEPPPNQFPQANSLNERYTIDENEVLTIDLIVTDSDNDFMVPGILFQDGTDPFEVGMSIDIARNEAGLLEARFIWDTNCRQYDFSEKQSYLVGLHLEDEDVCEVENPNVIWLDLGVIRAQNTRPVISIGSEDSVSALPGETITFDVSALDADQDIVNLYMETKGFSAEKVKAFFPDAQGEGEANSSFSWTTSCDHLAMNKGNNFVFYFIVSDLDKRGCKEQNFDTLEVEVHFNLENSPPEFQLYSDTIIEVNKPFVMDITAHDNNVSDLLTLSFFDAVERPVSPSLSFKSTTGTGTVSSVLEWTPECELLDKGESSALYNMAFLVYDDACPASTYDTMKITFEIRETRYRFDRFEPPNVFTPNGDGINDTYSLSNLSVPRYNLPSDNCGDSFQYVSIYDRNGNIVFETDNREFEWDGGKVEGGNYYYFIKYTQTEYKGFLKVLK